MLAEELDKWHDEVLRMVEVNEVVRANARRLANLPMMTECEMANRIDEQAAEPFLP
jgi:hypothetical protein